MNYMRLNQSAKALEDFQKAAKIYDSLGNKPKLADIYNNIGAMYVPLSNHKQDAFQYFNKAMVIHEAMGNKAQQGFMLVNIGYIYETLDSFATELKYLKKALPLYEQFHSDNKDEMSSIYAALGTTYTHIEPADLSDAGFRGNQYDTAMFYLQKALALSRETGDEYGEAVNMKSIGVVYLKQKNYVPALNYLNQARKLSQSVGSLGAETDITYFLSEAYKDVRSFDSAYMYYVRYARLNDSMNNEGNEQVLFQKEIQYNFDKKEDSLHFQNALLSKNNSLSKLQLRQQWLYSIGVLLLLLSIGGFIFYRNRNRHAKLVLQLEKERAEQKQRESEFERKVSDAALHSLRSQMNPHFIFNCLNSIKLYAVENNQDAATAYLGKFSRLMRLVLENSKSDRITLQQEVETLQLYMEMEAMRFKEKLQYKIDIGDNVDMDYIEIPPMLIQPYIENAIWHGLMPKEEGGTILVTFICRENSLQITVTDNGVGRARAAELKSKSAAAHKSFGMSITHERIELINQMYQTSMSVVLNDLLDEQGNAAGTEVVLDIPID
ncbi:MAG: tetratricopeptide repeat protein [Chitinophagaceae bacterium]|nr:MAG: tetratricopeptide repeat protein [Chitinophagaceae bacterium]